MFVSGSTGAGVAEYTLSTAFDVSTASHVDTLDVSSHDTFPKGHAFNNDGTIMYVVGLTGKDVNQYNLSTAFDVSTASYINKFSVSSQETAPMGITFNNDGTKMFIVGHSSANVNEYTLSAAFNITTASYDSSFSVASQELYPSSVKFGNDGKKMFIVGIAGDEVNEYDLSTGFDVSLSLIHI